MSLYDGVHSGQIDFWRVFSARRRCASSSLHSILTRFDVASISDIQEKLSASAVQSSQFVATRALSIGQNTAHLLIGFGLMLYLLFFLLRDGRPLSHRIRTAVPLSASHKQHLVQKFTTVVRATVKGNVAVAVVQEGSVGRYSRSLVSRARCCGAR